MNIEYFLGANSSRGFYSLYSEFCSREGDYLHIIKGGPGTGKSGFMRQIGRAAEKKGYDVEYILCSGDPDSLDGIYIPALHRGWVDGTAPHVTEPRCFGYDSDYVNLGEFCSLPMKAEDRRHVSSLYSRYRACYTGAYDYLKALALLRKNRDKTVLEQAQQAELRRVIHELLDGSLEKKDSRALFVPRFLHALCCKGELYLNSSVLKLCKQYYVFNRSKRTVDIIMRTAAELASAYVTKLIVCPDPLEPELFEAVLLPEPGLGFIAGSYGLEAREKLLPEGFFAQDGKEGESSVEQAVEAMALERLAEAKRLHDELESFYKAAMDFAALDDFTDEYVKTAVE